MQFYDNSSTKQGIVQDVYFGVGANSNSYPIADVTRAINNGLDKVSSIILKADNRWQFDDTNNITLPIATTNLVNNQQDYQFDSSFLEVVKVLVADESGNFFPVRNIDVRDQNVFGYLQNLSSNRSIPQKYDVIGNSILLDPTPNYSYTNGLKVYFKRKMGYFTTSDTTKVPGFDSRFHKYLSLFAQYEYAHAKVLNKAEKLKRDMLEMEKDIEKHYSRRLKDYTPRFIPRVRSSE